MNEEILKLIRKGVALPATPLALTAGRQFDAHRQKVLMRYYVDAGVGGVAVGMHFTQFEIRNPGVGMYEPVMRTCAEELDRLSKDRGRPLIKIAGLNGLTADALGQARLAKDLGYDFAIVSMAAFGPNAMEQDLLHHMREIAKVMPVFGFYLLTGVGGIPLPYSFWRGLVDIENIYGIKIAPFERYGTVDVVRAVADAGRQDQITLYTGNDDSILYDLVTPFDFGTGEARIRGGLLGQWACWTKTAVEFLESVHAWWDSGEPLPREMLTLSAQMTDANAAIFDVRHNYAGSIPGVNEILRRQGLLERIDTLKFDEVLAPGQSAEIDRVRRAYPHLTDDAFVAENLERWLAE
ncbi:MAG: dihydrodipicolinate synthase family protein [Opitutales bacterium]